MINIYKKSLGYVRKLRQITYGGAVDGSPEQHLVDRQLVCYLLFWLSVLLTVFALAADLLWIDKNWFGRSGAIIVGVGIAASYYRDASLDPYYLIRLAYSKEMNELRAWHTRKIASATIIGTLIWAFGDFVPLICV